jgi:polysaccharide lyase-like protein
MNEFQAPQAALDSIAAANYSARVSQLELITTRQAALIAQLQGVALPPVALPLPTIVWHAGMETGNLSEWPSQNNNTGPALSTAVQAALEGIPPRTTPWVMKQAVTGAVGATRMGTDTVKLVEAGTEFWVTWWDYYPAQIKFGAADMFMFLQIAGVDAGGSYNPVWSFYPDGGTFTPRIIWSPNDMAPAEGPHAGENGKRVYTTSTPIPVGKWTKFELYVKPAADFTGALKLWMDGAPLFDQSAIKTRYPGSGAPGVPGYSYMEHTAYGSNLTPTPAVHYVDDVTISLGRMP